MVPQKRRSLGGEVLSFNPASLNPDRYDEMLAAELLAEAFQVGLGGNLGPETDLVLPEVFYKISGNEALPNPEPPLEHIFAQAVRGDFTIDFCEGPMKFDPLKGRYTVSGFPSCKIAGEVVELSCPGGEYDNLIVVVKSGNKIVEHTFPNDTRECRVSKDSSEQRLWFDMPPARLVVQKGQQVELGQRLAAFTTKDFPEATSDSMPQEIQDNYVDRLNLVFAGLSTVVGEHRLFSEHTYLGELSPSSITPYFRFTDFIPRGRQVFGVSSADDRDWVYRYLDLRLSTNLWYRVQHNVGRHEPVAGATLDLSYEPSLSVKKSSENIMAEGLETAAISA